MSTLLLLFKKAGETLDKVWSEAIIDGFPLLTEWRGGKTLPQSDFPSPEWLAGWLAGLAYTCKPLFPPNSYV